MDVTFSAFIQFLRERKNMMASSAMDNVENAIDAGDIKTSLKVLDSLGVFSAEPPGPELADAVKEQEKIYQSNQIMHIDS